MGELFKLLLVLVIVLLLFSHRLPSIARSLGQSVSEFKKGVKELENESDNEKSE
ncbi:MAG TPA: twin-arginine translocase TatA/TatE family subunit [Lacipirellulaceae bacterium]|nr:twin-arginine translocase TatA/TatE family subunit [Lacipirellulaceae bacterium]